MAPLFKRSLSHPDAQLRLFEEVTRVESDYNSNCFRARPAWSRRLRRSLHGLSSRRYIFEKLTSYVQRRRHPSWTVLACAGRPSGRRTRM
jgi:hypothetical protein